jgi:hypothetical protein
LRMLSALGEDQMAMEEIRGYNFAENALRSGDASTALRQAQGDT